MTAIRRGTARRLGIRPPLAARVLQLADTLDIKVDPWQKHVLSAIYRQPDRPLAARRSRPGDRWRWTLDQFGTLGLVSTAAPAPVPSTTTREPSDFDC